MSLSVGPFVRLANVLVEDYLPWLNDFESQREECFIKEKSHIIDVAEGFLEQCNHAFDVPGVTYFRKKGSCDNLINLYKKVKTYTREKDSVLNSFEEEKVFSDPNWIEIRDLAAIALKDLSEAIEEAKQDPLVDIDGP